MAFFRTWGARSACPTSERNVPACHEQHQGPRRRGASTVEFALVAPAIFLFILTIVELGRGFMVAHLLSNAARQGCRAGVIQGTSTADIKKRVTDSLKAQGVPGAKTKVLVNGAEADAAGAEANDKITVEVSIPVRDFTWVPGGQLLQGSLGSQYSLNRE